MNFISVDLSLRSTGLVVLNKAGILKDFAIVSNKDAKEEELLEKNSDDILSFILKNNSNSIAIEGVSFMSISSSKDIIYGNFWVTRCKIKKIIKDSKLFIIPVSRWRKDVISKERAKELKETLGEVVITKSKKGKETKKIKMPKNWQKLEVVSKLPSDIKESFDKYIKENNFKKESMYDLADAYWLCRFLIKEK